MIDDELANLMPVDQRLSPRHRMELKERIMTDLHTSTDQYTSTNQYTSTDQHTPAEPAATVSGRHSRRLVGVIAAALVVTTAAAAAAVGLGGPDPQQAATVVDQNVEAAQVHLDGWRPELRSESVACVGTDSPRLTDPRAGGQTTASEFPLTDPLTAERLIDECTGGTDEARLAGGHDPARATVCMRDTGALLPVVALDGQTCEQTGDDIRPASDADFARLNEMRGFEVAVLANPDGCPTEDEAIEWARRQVDARGESLVVTTEPDSGGALCYGASVYWEWNQVLVGATEQAN